MLSPFLIAESKKIIKRKEIEQMNNTKTNDYRDYYVVRKLELVNYLCRRGFEIKKVEDSFENPRFKIFLFQNTETLRNEINRYYEKEKAETKKVYVIKTIAMMNYLCDKGFKVLKVEDSRNNPEYKVFLFEDTQELHHCMDQYMENQKGR